MTAEYDVDPKKVLVAGDTHGDSRHFAYLCMVARDNGCEVILQVGDFGFWPKDRSFYPRFHRTIEEQLAAHDLRCFWIDGNHEDHDALNEIARAEEASPTLGKFWKVAKRCFYVPRGTRWTWNGVRMLGLGGAYSIDRKHRIKGYDWFEQEVLSDEDVKVGRDEVDIMFTHDVPFGVLETELGTRFPASVRNRERVLEVVEAVKPKLLMHGHLHHRYEKNLPYKYGGSWCKVVGLDCNLAHKREDSWVVLDLDDPHPETFFRA